MKIIIQSHPEWNSYWYGNYTFIDFFPKGHFCPYTTTPLNAIFLVLALGYQWNVGYQRYCYNDCYFSKSSLYLCQYFVEFYTSKFYFMCSVTFVTATIHKIIWIFSAPALCNCLHNGFCFTNVHFNCLFFMVWHAHLFILSTLLCCIACKSIWCSYIHIKFSHIHKFWMLKSITTNFKGLVN